MSMFKKIGLAILGIFAAIAIGVGGLIFNSYWQDKHIKHEFTLMGLVGPVHIRRDDYGIPHIIAKQSDLDAFYALGYLHAEDRLWQMEFQRRVASGTLSEIFGKKTLKQDEYLRTWGFYRAAAQVWDVLDERTKNIVQAYTAGVNAYLSTGKRPLPFYLLRFKPKRWTVIDTLAWEKMMAWNLDSTWEAKIKNYLIAKQYGQAAVETFFPAYPASAATTLSQADLTMAQLTKPALTEHRVVMPSLIKLTSRQTTTPSGISVDQNIRQSLGMQNSPGKGSNGWVVSGRLTTTGKPMLADDPHLDLAAPSLWYQAELRGPGLHVIGATIPGMPVVVIGHNDHIAWGVTSGYADAQDLYIEPENKPLMSRQEIINIRGSAPEILTVSISVHGPIISPVTEAKYVSQRVAIRWPALEAHDTSYNSFVALNYAKNQQDFVDALRAFVTPTLNFIYADTAGNIGYYLAGKIPVRHGWSGAYPVSALAAHEWQDYIPFDQLPHCFNPPEGYLVSANNRIVPESYPYTLTFRWSVPPFRVERIKQLITNNVPLTVEKNASIQMDTQSRLWLALADELLKTKPLDADSAYGLKLLSSWNGMVDVNSAAASVFAYWYQELTRSPVAISSAVIKADPMFLIAELQHHQCYVHGQIKTCDNYLSETLQIAMHKLIAEHGQHPKGWLWGKVHQVVFRELILGQIKAIGWLWNQSAAAPGGDYTVNVGTYDLNMHEDNGPSYRQIIDLGHLDHSQYVIPLGEQNGIFSRHKKDQLSLWLEGKYVPMKTDAEH